MASVSWLCLPIEDHVFYLALGYFISYLPYALVAKAVSSGIVPGVDRPVGGLIPSPIVDAVHGRKLHVYSLVAVVLSLLAVAVSFGDVNLGVTAGLAPPGSAQLIAVAFVVGAVVALSYPALRANLRGTTSLRERVVLFVCGGNQSRSVMGECIARAAMATARSGHQVTIQQAVRTRLAEQFL